MNRNIDDPTDFPANGPSKNLRNLDSSVRCPICTEYFDGPVSLQCGHSFCSLCIRNTMAATSQSHCPTCRAPAKESQLRPNPTIEEIVAAWQPARAAILDLAKREHEEQPARKKRKLDDPDPPSSAGPSRTSSSDSKASESASDSLVDCPVCHRQVPMATINLHIDNNCDSSDSPHATSSKSQWLNIMAPKSKGKGKDKDSDDRIPKQAYDTLKEWQIKAKLEELGLSTTGDRSTLVARHQHWSMLWNGNLDRSTEQRQSKERLRKTLKKWEAERQAPRKEKPTVDASHLKTHNSEFKRLIEAARPRKEPPTEEVIVVD
ncbi:hypothetical protein C8F01DRAFT_1133456 [Mycena amicta]|nr:hypothetical protein C8F01DRAFT_1133456 [Mycena amicta]